MSNSPIALARSALDACRAILAYDEVHAPFVEPGGIQACRYYRMLELARVALTGEIHHQAEDKREQHEPGS